MAQNPAFAGEPASSAILAGPEASAALPATINTMLCGVSPEVVLDVVSLVDELVADAAFGRLLVDEVATNWGTRGSTTWAEVQLAG